MCQMGYTAKFLLTVYQKCDAKSLWVVVSQDVQELFASTDAGIVGGSGVLEINDNGDLLDMFRH